ncbi:hypothetical protein [Streptomyces murinus]|uniref:hypothetical protein n=1 Tax=Streptomyces murinus TaxID=33900 RepID=UPI003F45AAB2
MLKVAATSLDLGAGGVHVPLERGDGHIDDEEVDVGDEQAEQHHEESAPGGLAAGFPVVRCRHGLGTCAGQFRFGGHGRNSSVVR